MMGMVWIASLLFLVLIVVGVVLLVRALRGRDQPSPDARSSEGLAILQERYARGEIDRDELEERRRTLES